MPDTAAVHSADMAPPTKDTVQITFRIPKEWLERADTLAPLIAPPGASFGRTDAFRAAIAKGLELLEREAKKRRKPDPRPFVDENRECLFCEHALDVPESAYAEVHAYDCPIGNGEIPHEAFRALTSALGLEDARRVASIAGGRYLQTKSPEEAIKVINDAVANATKPTKKPAKK